MYSALRRALDTFGPPSLPFHLPLIAPDHPSHETSPPAPVPVPLTASLPASLPPAFLPFLPPFHLSFYLFNLPSQGQPLLFCVYTGPMPHLTWEGGGYVTCILLHQVATLHVTSTCVLPALCLTCATVTLAKIQRPFVSGGLMWFFGAGHLGKGLWECRAGEPSHSLGLLAWGTN